MERKTCEEDFGDRSQRIVTESIDRVSVASKTDSASNLASMYANSLVALFMQ